MTPAVRNLQPEGAPSLQHHQGVFFHNLLRVHTQPPCPLGLRNQSRGASSPRELRQTSGSAGSGGISRAAARTAGQAPGSALLAAPARAAQSAESRERCGGSSGPAVAEPGAGSAPRVSLSSAPAAALPQPPPSCRLPPTPRVRGHGRFTELCHTSAGIWSFGFYTRAAQRREQPQEKKKRKKPKKPKGRR